MYHKHLLCIIHTSNTIMKMSINNIKHITTRETSYTWFTPSMRLRPPKLVSLYIILSREDLQFRGTYTANLFHQECSSITILLRCKVFPFKYQTFSHKHIPKVQEVTLGLYSLTTIEQ